MASLSIEDARDRKASVPAPSRRLPASYRAFIAALEHYWGEGSLTLVGPDGSLRRIEGAIPGGEARLEVRNGASFVRRLIGEGDVGFAEGWIAGDWDSPDLATLLTVFANNLDRLERVTQGRWWLRLANAVSHGLKRNSRAGSRRNIMAHYDLGDDFYGLWLDGGMNYSSALYDPPGIDLAAAQRRKHQALADQMDLRAGQSVLEIGCGWGGFAAYAAAERGASVTAITISPSQAAFAQQRIQAEGLNERVEVRLCDYRDVQGQFDRVASIEMFEAVGVAYWPAYFDKVRDTLKPDGRAGLQIITIEDRLFEQYRRQPDFIQLHVFPRGMLAGETRLKAETDRAGLQWTGLRRFGVDYAETLADWGRRYRAHAAEVRAQGFDARFDRLWRYYLAYSEAGFRTRRTDVIQLGLARG